MRLNLWSRFYSLDIEDEDRTLTRHTRILYTQYNTSVVFLVLGLLMDEYFGEGEKVRSIDITTQKARNGDREGENWIWKPSRLMQLQRGEQS